MINFLKSKIDISNVITFFVTIAIALVVVGFIRVYYSPIIVNGDSMNPTYSDGDIIHGNPTFETEDISRGTVVVFKKDAYNKNMLLIKRVIGLPGEVVDIKNGYIYINNKKLMLYTFEDIEDPGEQRYPLILGDNEYFCVGDNRNNSTDSRKFGPVQYSEILYIVDKIYIER